MTEKLDQLTNHFRIDNLKMVIKDLERLLYHLNLLIATIGQVGQGPDGVDQDVGILVANQLAQRRQKLLNCG